MIDIIRWSDSVSGSLHRWCGCSGCIRVLWSCNLWLQMRCLMLFSLELALNPRSNRVDSLLAFTTVDWIEPRNEIEVGKYWMFIDEAIVSRYSSADWFFHQRRGRMNRFHRSIKWFIKRIGLKWCNQIRKLSHRLKWIESNRCKLVEFNPPLTLPPPPPLTLLLCSRWSQLQSVIIIECIIDSFLFLRALLLLLLSVLQQLPPRLVALWWLHRDHPLPITTLHQLIGNIYPPDFAFSLFLSLSLSEFFSFFQL